MKTAGGEVPTWQGVTAIVIVGTLLAASLLATGFVFYMVYLLVDWVVSK